MTRKSKMKSSALTITITITTLLLVLGGCGGTEAEIEISQQVLPVIGGKACGRDAFPASVGLIFDAEVRVGGESGFVRMLTCTGTLIAPDAVLTAAHCVNPTIVGLFDIEFVGIRHYVTFEPDSTEIGNPELLELQPVPSKEMLPALPPDAVVARSAISHPGFDYIAPSEIPGELDNVHDIALLLLQEQITDVAPAVVISDEEAAQLEKGTRVSVVGWGLQIERDPFAGPQKGTNGRKMCGESSIAALGDHEMYIGAADGEAKKCVGDSGGPVFAEVKAAKSNKAATRLVGVASRTYGDTGRCDVGTIETRVDAWRDWIEAQLVAGCDEGTRAWCEVRGIPDGANVGGTKTTGTNPSTVGKTDEEKPSGGGGCQAVNGKPTYVATILLVSLILVGVGVRRTTLAQLLSTRTSCTRRSSCGSPWSRKACSRHAG